MKERDAQTFIINMEVNKAKSEGIKKQKQAAMKALNVMVKYCESVSCRHALFSKHFGDTAPACKHRCDACSDRKAADDKLQSFATSMDRRSAFRTAGKMDSDYSEMYGEGRRGQKREADSYFGDDDDGDGGRRREKAAREERDDEIKRQFKMRKKGKEKVVEKPKAKLGHARVRAAEFTETKVAGLDLKTRESYYDLLVSALTMNYEATRSFNTKEMTTGEIGEAGVEAEYKAFTSITTTTMYRSKLAKLIQKVKKETSDLLFTELLSSFTPPKEEIKNLASLAKEVKEQIGGKGNNDENEKQRTEKKERKTGGFRLKREKEKQQTIGKFFQAKSDKSVSPDLDYDPGRLTLGATICEGRVDQDLSVGGVPCPICLSTFPLEKVELHAATCQEGEKTTEEVGKIKTVVSNGGSSIHALSDSEEEDKNLGAGGDVDPNSKMNVSTKNTSSSAFLDTRRRWQEKLDGVPQQSHVESAGINEQVPSQKYHGSLHEDDSFVTTIESDPFVEGESVSSNPFYDGDSTSNEAAFLTNGDSSFSKINGSTEEVEDGIHPDRSYVKDSSAHTEFVKGEPSNLAKLLDKMKRNMEAEETEKEKRRLEDQRVLVEKRNSRKETVSSQINRHRSSKISLKSALKQNREICDRAELEQTNKRDETFKRSADPEDAAVTESRKRLEAKLKVKRREASSHKHGNGNPLGLLNTPSRSESSLVNSQQDKKKVADEFVTCLSPFLKSGRIVSKEAFKVLARDLTHMAVKTGMEMTRGRVKATIDAFFDTNTEPVEEETVKELLASFHI